MSRQKRMPTLWEVPDDLWERIQELLDEYDPPKPTGRGREDARKILDGLIFKFRTGCQWNHIPKVYGDDSTIHRTFQRWVQLSLFEMIWSLLVAECDELGLVQWQWQAADGSLGKARSGGDQIGPNPTDRAKQGSKKSLLVDGQGGPLSLVVAAANVNDHLLLEATLEAVVVERPEPRKQEPQNLCLDAGYNNAPSQEVVKEYGYRGHIRPGGAETLDAQGAKQYPARRWVVERTFGWLSKCRGLLVRYEKKSENYLALLQFACALLWYRRLPKPETAFG
jgi:putative transposase